MAITRESDIELWDLSTGKQTMILEGHTDLVEEIQYSPDGVWMVSASWDKTIVLWYIPSGTAFKTLKGHNEKVHSAVFSHDMTKIVSASDDFTCRIWELWELKNSTNYPIIGPIIDLKVSDSTRINSVAFNPNGKMIATGAGDNLIRLYDTKGNLLQELSGHSKPIRKLIFCPNQPELLSYSDDGMIILWDYKHNQTKLLLEGYMQVVNDIAYSNNGKYIFSCSDDKTLQVWERSSGKQLRVVELGCVYECIAVSPDDSFVIAGSSDSNIYLWQTKHLIKGYISIVKEGSVKQYPITPRKFTGHKDTVNAISFSLDGSCFASASIDGTIKVWKSKDTPITFEDNNNYVNSIVFSSDGKKLVTCYGWLSGDSCKKDIKLLDVSTGAVIITLSGHDDCINEVAFSKDGRLLASASDDGTVKLWKIPNLQGLINKVRRQFSNYRPTPEERKKYYLD